MMKHERHNLARHTDGVTLIELLVTISIIGILVAIGVPLAAQFLTKSESLSQGSVLKGLAAAADEYNIVTSKVVDHKSTTDLFGNSRVMTVNPTSPSDDNTFGWFVVTAGQVPTTEKLILATTKSNLINTNGGVRKPVASIIESLSSGMVQNEVELLDLWGQQVRYAYAVSHADTYLKDDYLPAHPTAFFVSSGPDEKFGDVNGTTAEKQLAEDNIYSFEVD